MADYKFDGKYFVDRSSKRVAEIDGNYLKDYSNSKRVAEIEGNYIKDYSNSKRVVEINGDTIKDYSNSKTLCSINDIRKTIDGPGGKSLVAFWWFFVR